MGDIIDLHKRIEIVEAAILEIHQKVFPERYKDEKKEKKTNDKVVEE